MQPVDDRAFCRRTIEPREVVKEMPLAFYRTDLQELEADRSCHLLYESLMKMVITHFRRKK